ELGLEARVEECLERQGERPSVPPLGRPVVADEHASGRPSSPRPARSRSGGYLPRGTSMPAPRRDLQEASWTLYSLSQAPVAERIESRTSNPKVVGSNPTGRACDRTGLEASGSAQAPSLTVVPAVPTPDHSAPSSRQEAHGNAPTRPLRATRGATRALP